MDFYEAYTFVFWTGLIVYALIFGFATRYIAIQKSKELGTWFWVGFFLGWIGLIIAAVSKDETQQILVEIEESYISINSDNATTNVCVQGDCPLLMLNLDVLKGESGSIQLECDFQNIGYKPINAVILDIIYIFIDDKELGVVEDFCYLDLNIKKYGKLGNGVKITIPDSRSRKFQVKVKKIMFEDESWWTGVESCFMQDIDMSKRISVESLVELKEQFSREIKEFKHQYLLYKTNQFAICGCGQVTFAEEYECPSCGAKYNFLEEVSKPEYLSANKSKYEHDQKKQNELKHRRKKQKIIIGSIFATLVVIISTVFLYAIPELKYAKAQELFENSQYEEAYQVYTELGEYKNSQDIAKESKYMQVQGLIENSQYEEAYQVYNELGKYRDAYDLMRGVGLTMTADLNLQSFVAAGPHYTILLYLDGTVVATGLNDKGQCEVENWRDIILITAGSSHTVGLKTNGTVIATGSNERGQCEVESWEDIIAVIAGSGSLHTIGLKSDGTVVATGLNFYNQCEVGSWKDIIGVAVGSSYTVGLKADGTVVAIGRNNQGQCEVGSWENITAVTAGSSHTVGLKADGTVVAIGGNNQDQCEVGKWEDIIAVTSGLYHTVGLKADGTVVATGLNDKGQCEVESWKDIIAVIAGSSHTVGLKADGTVVATGLNDKGQCEVDEWTMFDINSIK